MTYDRQILLRVEVCGDHRLHLIRYSVTKGRLNRPFAVSGAYKSISEVLCQHPNEKAPTNGALTLKDVSGVDPQN